ncbi:CTP synthetase [Salinarchaeum sp. Harcht-Bsk1]|uniref:DUF7126 family protein n=1 Tax=Salinarchaeum sp. Harcht-Bsk1 TaxID=1333523 RepID=UPI00034235CA|nr:hypothetical protein [Salinarchaeum sp. Harcht-Bsk1]AGN01094.1 CTP synthetase [Salinarchaeum sp. Harcht-Bsk1]
MTTAVLVGPDADGLGDALEDVGVTVTRVGDVATRPDLEEAGILDADLLVVTDVEEATTIPIATDLNPDVRAVVYDRAALPEFVSAQTDLAVDPELLGPADVAEALVED